MLISGLVLADGFIVPLLEAIGETEPNQIDNFVARKHVEFS